MVAYELAAAGIGRLVLAHAGVVRPDDHALAAAL
jgi:hypothetical protein